MNVNSQFCPRKWEISFRLRKLICKLPLSIIFYYVLSITDRILWVVQLLSMRVTLNGYAINVSKFYHAYIRALGLC